MGFKGFMALVSVKAKGLAESKAKVKKMAPPITKKQAKAIQKKDSASKRAKRYDN